MQIFPKDLAARHMALVFYRTWLGDGLDMAEAYREAVLSVRQRWPSLVHWAPFVLAGDAYS